MAFHLNSQTGVLLYSKASTTTKVYGKVPPPASETSRQEPRARPLSDFFFQK